MSKNNTKDWRPTAALSNIKLRAAINKKVRNFFEDRDVLEVETPLICHSSATDPQLVSFETYLKFPNLPQKIPLHLQTSPEFPMKRLLAAGYGSIYQICKAFRNGEVGRRHNPEFTILEWYRVGFTHFDLMDEVDDLLNYLLATQSADKISYLELYEHFFKINPHTISIQALQELAEKKGVTFEGEEASRDVWLDLIMTHLIEPHLGLKNPIFIYDYPGSQAALARIRSENGYQVGERFEVYYKGVELANGYHELANEQEQLSRFLQDNQQRERLRLPTIPVDRYLLSALSYLPECAGVALGLDRLICLAANTSDIDDVISFPISRA